MPANLTLAAANNNELSSPVFYYLKQIKIGTASFYITYSCRYKGLVLHSVDITSEFHIYVQTLFLIFYLRKDRKGM